MPDTATARTSSLTPERYLDKILGGWVGKCAGGILGAPIEGYKRFNRIELSDELFANNFANDDLDLQVLWLAMMDERGPWAREADFAEYWRRYVDFPWCEYGIAARNVALGLDPPDSGRHNNWYWSESMGSPIRSEIWGMLFPGRPERAAAFARMDSELDHTGFSVHAEQFFSACAALAFVEEDLETILDDGLSHIPGTALPRPLHRRGVASCAQLIARVREWYGRYGFKTTAGKIKSHYGDADFTAAPMNVGFTVLSILHAGKDFDRIIESLHLGHDSDCVVATAAALLGILRGNDAIPQQWKERVGNELLISPEIGDIRKPATLTELAEWTREVGQRIEDGWPVPDRPFALRMEAKDPPASAKAELALAVENFRDEALKLQYEITSDYFDEQSGAMTLTAGEEQTTTLPIDLQRAEGKPTRSYTVTINAEGKEHRFERGLPDYGSWLLIGPFIQDDPLLEPMDETYPDHGLSSMPSVRYMNHDRVNDGGRDNFIDQATIEELLDGRDRDGRPYGVTVVKPTAMSVDLGDYFHGRGERTLYLTTRVHAEADRKLWLCLGSTSFLTVRVNGERVLRHRETSRRWPATAVAEILLTKGKNTLTIRMDTSVDDYRLDVGLKDHAGRHHHQSAWNTDLAFRVKN